MKKVFIDGESGTTGLKIFKRLGERDDIELISLPEQLHRDAMSRKTILNEADIVFLCLPDAAAIEAADMVENPETVVIDTSTAHRTADGWAYGFPELSKKHYEKIRASKRISVPGCHASGFIALIYPLIECGLMSNDTKLSCFSLTGYSGGGKKMIVEYESEARSTDLDSPRIYALSQQHKHLREMKFITGIENEPHFSPIVADYFSGILMTVPLFPDMVRGSINDIKSAYAAKYYEGLVSFREDIGKDGLISGNGLSGKDIMYVSVGGNDKRLTLYAQYDNLGKGASGAAIECLNIVIGATFDKGLIT